MAKTSVVRGNPFEVTITGRPDSAYYLWVKGTGSMSGAPHDEPPSIVPSQDGVHMDPAIGPWPIGQYGNSGSDKTIQSDVAQFYGDRDVSGTSYYASVTLSASGTRSVRFQTTGDTVERNYTIRVERPDPFNPPASDTGTGRQFKSDEVDISVQNGNRYYLGSGFPDLLSRR